MNEKTADGRKTESPGERCDRVAAGLERLFENCESVVRDCFGIVAQRGRYWEEDLRNIAAYLKIGAQLGGQIARLETVRNRGSIPQ